MGRTAPDCPRSIPLPPLLLPSFSPPPPSRHHCDVVVGVAWSSTRHVRVVVVVDQDRTGRRRKRKRGMEKNQGLDPDSHGSDDCLEGAMPGVDPGDGGG